MTRTRRQYLAWWGVIALLWSGWLAMAAVQRSLPASWWFQAAVPLVEDTPRGLCPLVSWEREINRPFHGEWVATLQRQTADGAGFYSFYSRGGAADYFPAARLPDPLSLHWWFAFDDDEPCLWPAGTYRLHTLWTITPDAGGQRVVRRTSPPFRILPSEGDGAR